MHAHQPRISTRPAILTIVVLAQIALGATSVAAQTPSGSSLPPASVAPWVSPAPYDVGRLKWTRSHEADGLDQAPILHDLAVGPDGRILLVGGIPDGQGVTPVVWGSADGQAWSRLQGDLPAGSVALDVLATDDGFMIVTESDVAGQGQLYRSDGTSLGRLDAPSGDLSAIERSPTGLHALGGSDAPTIWTSTDDGATWTPAGITAADAVARHLAVTDDGTIVAVGLVSTGDDLWAPTAWSSTDAGTSWTSTSLPLDPGRWVVADLGWTPIGLLARIVDASTGDASGIDLVSRDGVAWQAALETPGWGSVGTVGAEAIVFGTDAAWHSVDGVSWTEERWPTLTGFDIVASAAMPDGRVVAAGQATAPSAPAATFIGTPPRPDVEAAPFPSPGASGVGSD